MKRLLAAFTALALVTASCSSPPVTPVTISTTLQQAASDASLIATGLNAELAIVKTIPGVDPTVIANMTAQLNKISADASAIESTVANGGTPGSSTVQEIASAVGIIANVVLPSIPGGGEFLLAINAAQALLPGLLSLAGVTAATAPTASAMTPAQARAVLQAAASKH